MGRAGRVLLVPQPAAPAPPRPGEVPVDHADRLTGSAGVEKRQARPARGQGVGYGGYFRKGHEKEWDELIAWLESKV